MARMSIYESNSFDDLWNMDFGGMATDALNESAPILEAKMKATARQAVLHEGESEMVESISASKAKKSKNGAYIVNVGPRGYSDTKVYISRTKRGGRRYAISNALKAIWKEYGIPGQQPAQPFISSATAQATAQVEDILQKKFEEYINES